jgi:hypothetical protein
MDPITAFGAAASIIGIVQFVGHIAHKTWDFLKKVGNAPKEAYQVAQNLYLISAICVEADVVVGRKNSALRAALKSLRSLCWEIYHYNGLGIDGRLKWAWSTKTIQYLLGRVEAVKSSFLTLLALRDSRILQRQALHNSNSDTRH